MQKDFQENASTRRNASSSAERWYVTYDTGVTPPAYEEGIKTTQRCGSYSVGKRASANCRQRTAGEKRQEGVSFPRKSWWGPRMSCTQQATCQFSSIFRNAEASPVLCHPSNAGTPPWPLLEIPQIFCVRSSKCASANLCPQQRMPCHESCVFSVNPSVQAV